MQNEKKQMKASKYTYLRDKSQKCALVNVKLDCIFIRHGNFVSSCRKV